MRKILLGLMVLALASSTIWALGLTGAIKKKVRELDSRTTTTVFNTVDNYTGKTDLDISDSYLESILISSGTDPQGDFEDPVSGTPPTGVTNYPPSDLVRIDIGSDGTYLYVRWNLAGTIPSDLALLSDNGYIHIVSLTVSIDSDNNSATGLTASKTLGAEAGLVSKVWYYASDNIVSNSYFWCKPDNENNTFQIYGDAEIVRYGQGRNYLVSRYKLLELEIANNSTIKICGGQVEVESTNYHHYSYDCFDSSFTYIVK
ncbi:MAG: hypothetical protein A2252_02505 [Elusimicrobia bacterium RIFOXYA2_FULL_39_19]|nr:MAG: hypothetical protein A2252_02505 [Elusimicrobia bacterium RIFOXYA2_FULL_39_19]